MKSKIITYSICFISLMLCCTKTFAQKSNYDLITKELTKRQRDLLKNEREVMKTNRDAFKATLTKEQLSILRDKTVSKNEIRIRLTATFSKSKRSG